MAERAVRVLDTTALLALRGNEAGADHVERILDGAKRGRGRVLLSFMTRMELLYLIQREEGEEPAQEALRLVDSFHVDWISCEPDILKSAAMLKARAGLSVADSWIAATALVHDAVLVHRDPEFAQLGEISQDPLGSR
ncbi:MAG: PIN domain-containing protein [Gemmatimonadaceae bacterium]